MSLIQSIILGLIQGLTEFLPVSSSGHLIFIPKLFGWAEQGIDFDLIVHLGTLMALVIYFRKKLWQIFLAFFGLQNKMNEDSRLKIKDYRKLGWLIILATIPAGVAGLLFNDKIDSLYANSAKVIGLSFIVWGVVLYFADLYSQKHSSILILEKINWKNSLFIGFMQAIALIPGTSRSGITMTAGMFSKFSKKVAAEFSFLISVPIIALAGLSGLRHLAKTGFTHVGLMPLIVGFLVSFLSGLVAVWFLLKIIQKWSFKPFVIYRIIVGLIILFFL